MRQRLFRVSRAPDFRDEDIDHMSDNKFDDTCQYFILVGLYYFFLMFLSSFQVDQFLYKLNGQLCTVLFNHVQFI